MIHRARQVTFRLQLVLWNGCRCTSRPRSGSRVKSTIKWIHVPPTRISCSKWCWISLTHFRALKLRTNPHSLQSLAFPGLVGRDFWQQTCIWNTWRAWNSFAHRRQTFCQTTHPRKCSPRSCKYTLLTQQWLWPLWPNQPSLAIRSAAQSSGLTQPCCSATMSKIHTGSWPLSKTLDVTHTPGESSNLCHLIWVYQRSTLLSIMIHQLNTVQPKVIFQIFGRECFVCYLEEAFRVL
jgi:hypothetical protein